MAKETLPLASTSRKKATLCVVIAVAIMMAVFITYNSFMSGNAVKTKNEQLDTNNIDFNSYNGATVELAQNLGNLEVETFTNTMIAGKFDLNDKQQTLEFVIDDYLHYISFQLVNTLSGDIINSFYTKKSMYSDKPDYFTIDGKELDPIDQVSTLSNFESFYGSDIPSSIIQLSLKIASLGYSGPTSTPIRMIHAIAMHLYKMPNVKIDEIELIMSSNVDILNNFYKNQKQVVNELESNRVIGNIFNTLDWCIASILSDDNNDVVSTDSSYCGMIGNRDEKDCGISPGSSCPTDCYSRGNCTLENRCDNECFGRCGNQCNCWLWVCGDCNCHCLCYNHDYYCSCDDMTNYKCWAFWEWATASCD